MKVSNFNLTIPTVTEGEYLLTNTMSAVIGIDEELKSLIEKEDITTLDSETCTILTELGILIPDLTNEYRTIEVRYESTKYISDGILKRTCPNTLK